MSTHAELVGAASRWLQKKCAVIITEIATTGEEPDALGWHGTHSTLVECKAGLSDFYSDRQKPFRRDPARGIGCRRYFMTPVGLVSVEKLPVGWGLLEFDGEKVKRIKESEYFADTDTRQEIRILLSTLRRIGRTKPEGVSIKHYEFTTKNRATVGTEDEP